MLEEWISAAEAYERVAEAADARLARHAICSRANDGLLSARARRLIVGEKTADDCEVPAGFWWARGKAALKQNWTTGDFETWIDSRVHCRAYGVEFRRLDIEIMLPRGGPKQPQADSEPGNYEPAARCRDELRTALGCDQQEAERLILRACRAGVIPSRCSTIWWRTTDRYGGREEEDSHVVIPDWFWENCLDDPDTILNWQMGRFAGRGLVDGDECKAIVSGVQFQVGAIVAIESTEARDERDAPLTADEPAGAAMPAGSVGRRLSEAWRPWVAELVAHIHDHGIPDGVGSQGQEELIKAVADALARRGEDAPGRSTVQPIVQAVLDRLRNAEN